MIGNIVASILGGILFALLVAAWNYREFFLINILCFTIYRWRQLRLSMAAIIRIEDNGRYLLVRNQHRPESFGPFGGVYKVYPTAKLVDKFEFQPQIRQPPYDKSLENDLRGMIPARNFHRFMKWFQSNIDRELQPISRELSEELEDVGIDITELGIERLQIQLVRRVHMNIQRIRGVNYLQFRHIDVYELNAADEHSKLLTAALIKAEPNNANLLLVTPGEIKRQRSANGAVIGPHTGYLIGNHPTGSEPPPFFD